MDCMERCVQHIKGYKACFPCSTVQHEMAVMAKCAYFLLCYILTLCTATLEVSHGDEQGHYELESVKLGDLQPGDQIACQYLFDSPLFSALHFHHGIYRGEGEVIHTSPTHINGVNYSSYEDFKHHCEYRPVYRVNWRYYMVIRRGAEKKTNESVVEVAEWWLEHCKQKWSEDHRCRFDSESNNCEHFASLCKIGIALCMQKEIACGSFPYSWLCSFAFNAANAGRWSSNTLTRYGHVSSKRGGGTNDRTDL